VAELVGVRGVRLDGFKPGGEPDGAVERVEKRCAAVAIAEALLETDQRRLDPLAVVGIADVMDVGLDPPKDGLGFAVVVLVGTARDDRTGNFDDAGIVLEVEDELLHLGERLLGEPYPRVGVVGDLCEHDALRDFLCDFLHGGSLSAPLRLHGHGPGSHLHAGDRRALAALQLDGETLAAGIGEPMMALGATDSEFPAQGFSPAA
jgi:hypothetical protein